MYSTLRVSLEEGLLLAVLDVPGKPMNVLTPAFMDDLERLLEALAQPEALGLVLTSGKPAFLAGADLKAFLAQAERETRPAAEVAPEMFRFSQILRRLETQGKPVAAAINGLALGGGFELCLACHHRVLSQDPRAKVGLPEVQVGLLPGAGGTQRLPRLIGLQASLPLLLEGKHLGPEQALAAGLVHELAPPDQVVARASAWARRPAPVRQPWDEKSYAFPGGVGVAHPSAAQVFQAANAMTLSKTAGRYPAARAILSCVFEGTLLPIERGLEVENQLFTQLFLDPVARSIIRSLFVHKGAADKGAARPAGVPKAPLGRVGILGAGMMGAGIAWVAAEAGLSVLLVDRTLEAAERGRDLTRRLARQAVERRKMTADAAQALVDRVATADQVEAVAGCELVIEAVFEDRALKDEILRRAEAVLAPTAVLASNTSTLPITSLARALTRPERFVGMHFFSPVEKMPLVEVIRGEATGPEAIARALDFTVAVKKTPIVVGDGRGFYTSRTCGAYLDEGQAMLLEGVPAALIEGAARHAGLPVGPLALADEVSIELGLRISEQTKLDLGEAWEAPAGLPVMTRLGELGRLGRKARAGFYDYPLEGKKSLYPGLKQLFPQKDAEAWSVEDLAERLLARQAIEAARCLEEGVLPSPVEGDLGALLGLGFPAWTGGPLSWIDTLGLATFVQKCAAWEAAHGPRFRVGADLAQRAAENRRFYPIT